MVLLHIDMLLTLSPTAQIPGPVFPPQTAGHEQGMKNPAANVGLREKYVGMQHIGNSFIINL